MKKLLYTYFTKLFFSLLFLIVWKLLKYYTKSLGTILINCSTKYKFFSLKKKKESIKMKNTLKKNKIQYYND